MYLPSEVNQYNHVTIDLFYEVSQDSHVTMELFSEVESIVYATP